MDLIVGCSECDADVPEYSRYLSQAKYEPLIDLIGIGTIEGELPLALGKPNLPYNIFNGRIINTEFRWSQHWLCYCCDLGGKAPWFRPTPSEGLINDIGHPWQPSTCARSLSKLSTLPRRGLDPIQVDLTKHKTRHKPINTVMIREG